MDSTFTSLYYVIEYTNNLFQYAVIENSTKSISCTTILKLKCNKTKIKAIIRHSIRMKLQTVQANSVEFKKPGSYLMNNKPCKGINSTDIIMQEHIITNKN